MWRRRRAASPYESEHYDAAAMRTHRDFWHHRFGLNLRPAGGLSEEAWVLREARDRYVAYGEV